MRACVGRVRKREREWEKKRERKFTHLWTVSPKSEKAKCEAFPIRAVSPVAACKSRAVANLRQGTDRSSKLTLCIQDQLMLADNNDNCFLIFGHWMYKAHKIRKKRLVLTLSFSNDFSLWSSLCTSHNNCKNRNVSYKRSHGCLRSSTQINSKSTDKYPSHKTPWKENPAT